MTKSKLVSLNEKLNVSKRRLELLEVQVGNASTNSSVFATLDLFVDVSFEGRQAHGFSDDGSVLSGKLCKNLSLSLFVFHILPINLRLKNAL
ncbi:hypothetical protein JHK85_008629 [Glycine max]|nr:hypothetical protein JHK85_008629 [Glycine max]KAG5073178.1 hypothetical protein JHK86_008389 [Glycine max]